jgi:hypothetical protein
MRAREQTVRYAVQVRWCASFVLLALTLACTACGGDEPFTPTEVMEAFDDHGIHLTEVIGQQPNSRIVASLGPADVPGHCSPEDLRVTVFRGHSDLDAQLARSGFEPGQSRFVVLDSEAGRVVGLVRDNVVAAVVGKSKCFSEARVKRPLDQLSE